MTTWKAETEARRSRIKEDTDKVKPGLEGSKENWRQIYFPVTKDETKKEE